MLNKLKKLFSKNTLKDKNFDEIIYSVSNIFDKSKYPIYLISQNFDLVWNNKALIHSRILSDSKKCFKSIFGRETICPSCPATFSIKMGEPRSLFVHSQLKNEETVLTKIYSNPISIGNKVFSINIIEEILCKGSEISSLSKDVIAFLDRIPSAVAVIDKTFKILYYNKDFETIFEKGIIEKNKNLRDLFTASLTELDIEEIYSELMNKSYSNFVIKHKNNKLNLSCRLTHFNILPPSDYFVLFISNFGEEINIEIYEKFELLTKIIENLKTGIIVKDELDQIYLQNPFIKKMLQISDEKIECYFKFFDLIEEMERKKENNIVWDLSSGGKLHLIPTIFDLKLQNSNKNLKIVCVDNGTEIYNLSKELEGLKEKLKIFETRIKGLILKISNENRILEVLGWAEDLTGFTTQDLVSGKINLNELVHIDDRHKVFKTFSEALHFPNYKNSIDFRIVKPSGEIKWVESQIENAIDERGKIQYAQLILYDITEQKLIEEQLKNSQEQMRNLALYFESLREEEKKRLAFEIHDELGHVLTAMKLELSWLLKKQYLREDVLHERLHKLIEMIDSTIRKVRSISSQLRPSVLDHFGIVAAIEWQAKEFQKQTAVRCRLNITKQEIQLAEPKAIAVFRIFQEILTNVARHSNATRVDINLDVDSNNLILTVSDNGKGIKPEDISTNRSLGIVGMKERANAVNGKLQIQGISNVGTTVTLTIPIN
ncbi:MAG: PAS domain S-box protein [Ignavibacteria bacterium]|nr:PAS domain S-box protein [Ignavibacteria bacterium]